MTSKQKYGLFFVAPALLLLTLFVVLPFILTIVYSFTNYYSYTPDSKEFVGLRNYVTLFSDPDYTKAILNTFKITLFLVPVQLVISFFLAYAINNVTYGMKLKGYYKIAYFAPMALSGASVAILFSIMLGTGGVINSIAQNVFGMAEQQFLSNPDQALWVITLMLTWHGIGYQMILFLAGMQSIPNSYYEAASIDGATGWKKLVHITLPSLKPITIFIFLTLTINAMKIAVPIMIMTGGGPDGATSTLMLYVFQSATTLRQIGLSSASAMVLFAIIMVISVIQRKALGDGNEA